MQENEVKNGALTIEGYYATLSKEGKESAHSVSHDKVWFLLQYCTTEVDRQDQV